MTKLALPKYNQTTTWLTMLPKVMVSIAASTIMEMMHPKLEMTNAQKYSEKKRKLALPKYNKRTMTAMITMLPKVMVLIAASTRMQMKHPTLEMRNAQKYSEKRRKLVLPKYNKNPTMR